MGNPVMQFQILSKTPDATASFYSKLFGWNVNADNPMGYRQIDTGSKEGIQGGIWPAPPQSPNFVQLFVAVEDVKASAKTAAGMGAKTIIPPPCSPKATRWRLCTIRRGWRSRCGDGITVSGETQSPPRCRIAWISE